MLETSDLADGRQGGSESGPSIFGAHGVEMRRAGLAVLPAKGKKPIRTGFNEWEHAPGVKAVEKWAEKNPGDNIVYIPGLSKTRRNPNGLVIVDADDAEMVAKAEQTFGKTPGMIDTRRGRHFLYRAPEGTLGKIGSLRKAGFNIDIKHGQKGAGISVAPPSLHDSGFQYGWTPGSGLGSLTDLPTFDTKALQALLDRGSKTLLNETQTAPAAPGKGTARTLGKAFPDLFRDGSRNLGLNDHLAAHAWALEDFDNALDVAQTWNDDLFARHGIEKLPDDEVVEVCKAVMADLDAGKLVRKHLQRATALTDADEVRQMMAMFSNGDSAFAFLMLLRAEHDARCKRGETFVLNVEGMVNCQTMGTWAARKYRDARDTLLAAGMIKCVREASYRRAAEYVLTDRVLTPSVAVRTKAL
jgi:hypothetical protein